MSALDRAIIKAYHRPAKTAAAAATAAATIATAGVAVPLSRALSDLDNKVEMAAPVSSSIGALLDEALQAELPASSAVSEERLAAQETSAPVEAESPIVAVFATAEEAAATVQDGGAAAPIQIAPPPAQNVTSGPVAAAPGWCPLLQVDRVVWPSIHNRLQGAAQAAVAQMTDGLQAIASSGRKTIGLACSARGEGVTTLLSAAARCLLERGKKVVLVDNRWSNPQLARSLGLLPQIGWEESLSGGLPLEEIVIESLADGLAVLPVREPPASDVAKAAIAANLEILARSYDFVLVDLGPLEEIEDQSTPAHDVAACMDAVVLVQNVRITPPHRLAEVRNRLAAANVRHAGTIQNFVAG